MATKKKAPNLSAIKAEVCRLNCELPKQGLVTWTSGNVSVRDPKSGLVVIKPSGVKFEDLKPSDMVVIDLEGNFIEGTRKPSVDSPTHLYIYKKRKDVNGVVHTHSQFATAFAAVGQSIPCYLTAMADEFGGAIPCAPYARIGGEEIGEFAVKYIGSSPAILMKNHGVFTIGATGEEAVKAAIMTEDVARTVHHALTIGKPDRIPADEVARAHRRYVEKYGQKGPKGGKVDKSI
jgi:L-ribulose-5-phosphate 4-epimerase